MSTNQDHIESPADALRRIADRLDNEADRDVSPQLADEQVRSAQQAGVLIEEAVRSGHLPPDTLPPWRPDDLQAAAPQPFPIPLLDRHVRWLTAISEKLGVDRPGWVRPEPGGLGHLDTRGMTDQERAALWRGRARTIADVCRVVAGEMTQAAEVELDDAQPFAPKSNHVRLLHAMASTSETMTLDLIAKTGWPSFKDRPSPRTVRELIADLVKAKPQLARRPHGDRSGAAITEAGRDLLGVAPEDRL